MKTLIKIIMICFLTGENYAQELNVINVSPLPQSLSALPQDPIVITFDQPLDVSSFNENSFHVFGRWSGPMTGEFNISGDGIIGTFIPDRPFFYGEIINVRLTKDIIGISTDPLTNGFGYNYWIKTKPALLNLLFNSQIEMRLPGENLIQCYGAYAGDINDDEYSDLVVVNENSEDIRVLFNDGAGNYSVFFLFDMPNANRPSTNEGSDFDHNGKIDIAIGSTQSNNVSVFMGNNSTVFENEINYIADNGVRGITVIDINGDGWDDIATANRIASNISILVNDGTGNFNAPINIETGTSQETAIVATDLNNDGYTDLIVGAYNSNEIVTLLNDGTGNFTVFDTVSINGSPWMITIGDLNGDGNVDVATANSSSASVSILFGDGNGNLSLSDEYSVSDFPLAIDVGDIDGDGDLDFIVSSFTGANFMLWENNGSGIFNNPITYPSVKAGSCAIFHDRNNDGALDLTLIDELADLVILYNNTPILATEEVVTQPPLTVYPNPFKEKLFLSRSINSPITFKLYDLLGRLILTKIINETNSINFTNSHLIEGLYIAELSYDKIITRVKVYKKN